VLCRISKTLGSVEDFEDFLLEEAPRNIERIGDKMPGERGELTSDSSILNLELGVSGRTATRLYSGALETLLVYFLDSVIELNLDTKEVSRDELGGPSSSREDERWDIGRSEETEVNRE